MKKMLTILLAAAMLFAMTTAAFADSRYYLANRPLDVAEAEEEPAYEEPDTDRQVPNENVNPGTGR